jgi:hypothetical protein
MIFLIKKPFHDNREPGCVPVTTNETLPWLHCVFFFPTTKDSFIDCNSLPGSIILFILLVPGKYTDLANKNHTSISTQQPSNAVSNHIPAGASQLPAVPVHDSPEAKPVQRKKNQTGMPDQLKDGIENLSGLSMDDVKVQYNSPKPAQLQAHAYAQGSDIHIAPGQEQHLAHEAWHVVQQKQGRVSPTTQLKDAAINDDSTLETEATQMGDRAASLPQSISGFKAAPLITSGTKVAQRALAAVKPQTGPLNLTQVDKGGGFLVLENAAQRDGKDVSDAVGYTGILDPGGWGDVANSPGEYHRAHGYAKSVGGAGDKTNVGWWPKDKETEWTQDEENAKGAGQAQIPAWKPGVGEVATYKVERSDHDVVDLQANYLSSLLNAVHWGLDDARAAWVRTKSFANSNSGDFPLSDVEAQKQKVVDNADKTIKDWLNNVFGKGAVESNLIKEMKMALNITTVGNNPGGSRASFTKTISAPKPKPDDFGLKDEPEKIWKLMVSANTGIFSKSGGPLGRSFNKSMRDKPTHSKTLTLTAFADGFGKEA